MFFIAADGLDRLHFTLSPPKTSELVEAEAEKDFSGFLNGFYFDNYSVSRSQYFDRAV
jgi:hypothetical protein